MMKGRTSRTSQRVACDWCEKDIIVLTDNSHTTTNHGEVVCNECFEEAVDEVLYDFRDYYGEEPGPEEAYRTCRDYVLQRYYKGQDLERHKNRVRILAPIHC